MSPSDNSPSLNDLDLLDAPLISTDDFLSITTYYADGTTVGSHFDDHLTTGDIGSLHFQPMQMGYDHFGFVSGSWGSFNDYPRQIADINGDGYDDIIGFGSKAVYVAPGQGDGTFSQHFVAHGNFNQTGGSWNSFNDYPRQVADVNGDGHGDIIGFGSTATYVALGQSNGTFGQHFVAHSDFNSATGWTSFDGQPRQVADINGDDRADIIGFGSDGVYVALGQSDGTFGNKFLAHDNFNQTGGSWSNFNDYPRQIADVNGDGCGDIIGFGGNATYVALGQNDGTFSQHFIAHPGFSQTIGWIGYGEGWSSFEEYPRQVADINGDGRADIVGFGERAIVVALGQADGTFGAIEIASFGFSSDDGAGWSSQNLYPRQLADLNNDGQADIIGFAYGTHVALSNPKDTLIGMEGDDILIGGAGYDRMIGDTPNSTPDIHDFNDGADTFVLGDATQAFYQGLGYATIEDFNWAEGDKIQLHGTLSDYSLGYAEDFGGSSALDTAIYRQGDLIGVVQDTTNVVSTEDFIFA